MESARKKQLAFDRLTLLLAVALAFFVGLWLQGTVDRFCAGSDRKEQSDDTASSIAKWCKKNRPDELADDYPYVGAVLAETATRLRSGTLRDVNDSIADTIARVQPCVSDAGKWRGFVSSLGSRITAGSAEQIAAQYADAAKAFGRAGTPRQAVAVGKTDGIGRPLRRVAPVGRLTDMYDDQREERLPFITKGISPAGAAGPAGAPGEVTKNEEMVNGKAPEGDAGARDLAGGKDNTAAAHVSTNGTGEGTGTAAGAGKTDGTKQPAAKTARPAQAPYCPSCSSGMCGCGGAW